MESVRMDKWLWAARFFKTRALAAKACELGRVQMGTVVAKPSRDVKVGDVLRVKNEGGEFVVEVVLLAEVRGPAPVAQKMYRETEESKELRRQLVEARKSMPIYESAWEGGRPTKRDRRTLNRVRGRG